MWQRFSENARKVVFFAQEEAQRFGEGYVSTEHMLLGLTRNPETVAARALSALGVSLTRIRNEVERQIPIGEPSKNQDMTLTPRAKRVIDLAYDEARELGDRHIGTEHLLLGLVREGDGLAARVLDKVGVDLDKARRVVSAVANADPEARSAELRATAQRNVRASKEFAPRQVRPSEQIWWISFAAETQELVWRAWEQAKVEGSFEVGASYLLTALLEDPASELATLLSAAGVDVPALESAAKDTAGPGRLPNPNTMHFSDEAREAISYACALAQHERAPEITPVHLLRGIVESGFASEQLASHGLTVHVARGLAP